MYNAFRPTITNLTYIKNSAKYGANIGSYPVKIILKGSINDTIQLNNVGSGIVYPESLQLSLIDYDRQVMKLENTTQIKITSLASNASVVGTDYAKVVEGVGTFDNLIFKDKPGSTNITYKATSKAIDGTKISAVFGSNFSQNLISVNFRFCQPGETHLDDDTCNECAQGTFSLKWNSTQCEKCMDNAVCLGDQTIEINPGYWRRTLNSTNIID